MQFGLSFARSLFNSSPSSLLGAIGRLLATGLVAATFLALGAVPQVNAQQNDVLIDQVGPNNAADNDATQNVSGSGNVVQAGQG
jgi:hypothetical protein